MPSSSRSTRSPEAMPITACSAAWAALALVGAAQAHGEPARARRRARRGSPTAGRASPDGGARTSPCSRRPGARARSTPASAESSVTDSSRGLASRLSPTQTVSKAPGALGVHGEVEQIARLEGAQHHGAIGEDEPERSAATIYLPSYFGGRLSRNELHALFVVVRGAQPRVGLALQLQRGLQRRVGPAVEHHLQRAQGQRRAARPARRPARRRRRRAVVGHRLGDEPPRLRPLGARCAGPSS